MYYYDDINKRFIHSKNGVAPEIISNYDPHKILGIAWSLGDHVSANVQYKALKAGIPNSGMLFQIIVHKSQNAANCKNYHYSIIPHENCEIINT